MNTYRITLLALLAALAVVGRYVFAFLPNVQPVTSLIIICGLLLGPLAAILLAILTTFLSNMLLGMGVWTVWQIVSWGLIGLLSGVLGKYPRKIPIWVIVIFSIFSGFLYGFVISLMTYSIAGDFWPYYLAGLPFSINHAVGNAIFIIVFYPIVSHLFKSYSNKHFYLKNTS